MRQISSALLIAAVGAGFAWAGLVVVYNDLPTGKRTANEFAFARLVYENRITLPGYYKGWYTDYPLGDRNLLLSVKRVLKLDAAAEPVALRATDPALMSYPFLYTSEPGHMLLGEGEALALREYLDRGGFWMLDDFWGSLEWGDLECELRKVFPAGAIEEVGLDHPLFHSFYDIQDILQVPNSGQGFCQPDCPTSEQDGYRPQFWGIHDASGKLVVLVCFNTDLMDGAELAGDARYPERHSIYALKVFINAIIYAMSH